MKAINLEFGIKWTKLKAYNIIKYALFYVWKNISGIKAKLA